jgi:hypothetical protein
MADIERSAGCTVVTGQGIELMRLTCLRSACKMAKMGMVLTRGMTRKRCLEMVAEVAGKPFPKGAKGLDAAIEWLDGYIIVVKGGCSVSDA